MFFLSSCCCLLCFQKHVFSGNHKLFWCTCWDLSHAPSFWKKKVWRSFKRKCGSMLQELLLKIELLNVETKIRAMNATELNDFRTTLNLLKKLAFGFLGNHIKLQTKFYFIHEILIIAISHQLLFASPTLRYAACKKMLSILLLVSSSIRLELSWK